MSEYLLFSGIIFIIAGLYFSIFNKQFTTYKINRRKKFYHKRNIHKYDSLLDSESYLLRQRIQYSAIGILFIMVGIYSILIYFNGINEIISKVFGIVLIITTVIVIVFYYFIKSRDKKKK